MRIRDIHWLAACAVLAFPAMIATPALAQAPAQPPPAPQMAPSLVPSYTVDLMTTEGSAAFGAQWKTMEARIVDVAPIKDALPAYKSGYDIIAPCRRSRLRRSGLAGHRAPRDSPGAAAPAGCRSSGIART